MQFTLKIRDKAASVSGISSLICGNSDYRILIDFDTEWKYVKRFLFAEILRGENSEIRFFPVPNHAVNLPAFYDADKILFWMEGGNLLSGKAEVPCERCITDHTGERCEPYFDLYNAVMEYAATGDESLRTRIQNYTPQPVTMDEYRYAVAATVVESGLTGTVTLENGSEISFTERDILGNSFGISATAVNGDFFLPGSAPSAELSCTFVGDLAKQDLSGADITANYEVQCHLKRRYSLPVGKFTVMDAQKSAKNHVQLTAYDSMIRLDNISVKSLGITENTAYSPQELLLMISQKSEIPYSGNTDGYVNSDCAFILSALDDTIATLRDLLMYTAQLLNCCAFIGRDGSLKLARLARFDPAVFVHDRQIVQSLISSKEYRLYTLSAIIQYREGGDNKSKSLAPQTLWPDGVYADLPENPLLRVLDTDNPQDMVNAIVRICEDLDFAVYAPTEIMQTSDPSAELAEWREICTESGTVRIPITAYQWTFHGGSSVSACGTEALAGIRKTQAEKIAAGERTSGAMELDNIMRAVMLAQLQSGNEIMQLFSNQQISHFTNQELCGNHSGMMHEELEALTHEELSSFMHGEIGG